MTDYKKIIRPTGQTAIVFKTEIKDKVPALTTEVYISDERICRIPSDMIAPFYAELNYIINKYSV